MTGPAPESLAAWSKALASMRRGSPIYKPAVLLATLDVLDQVHAAGMHATIGGMLESGLGRHVLAALAPLPAFTLVGDLSPAGRWLADDPFPDITMRSGMIAAPSRLGIAGEPFANRLERYTVRRATVTAATALAAVTNR